MKESKLELRHAVTETHEIYEVWRGGDRLGNVYSRWTGGVKRWKHSLDDRSRFESKHEAAEALAGARERRLNGKG